MGLILELGVYIWRSLGDSTQVCNDINLCLIGTTGTQSRSVKVVFLICLNCHCNMSYESTTHYSWLNSCLS